MQSALLSFSMLLPELAMSIQGTLTASWSHSLQMLSGKYAIMRHLLTSTKQMDIFNVAVKPCGRSHRGRGGEMVPALGFMCTHSLTLNAWCLQSASRCHGELVRSYSCTAVQPSASVRPTELPCENRKTMDRKMEPVGECGCGDPVGTVLSPDFNLS